MSKIGRKPVEIGNVDVKIVGQTVVVKGPKGEGIVEIPPHLSVAIEDGKLNVSRDRDDKKARAIHGLVRSLVANFVTGVVEPWRKTLEIHGVGYRVKLEGKKLVMNLGLSHQVNFEIPEPLSVEVKGTKITVIGVNKQFVGEIAAKIKDLKKPDKYKGKGIRYEGQVLKLKPGKKAKAGA